ncbi:MAG: DUF882 domain-containing protein [Alphaproteobacteria bacterium]
MVNYRDPHWGREGCRESAGTQITLVTRRIDSIITPVQGALGHLRLPLSAVLLCFLIVNAQFASAASERTLTFHSVNTGETTSVTYMRDGRYSPEGMAQLNYVLRDWRQDEPTQMDPRLIDLVWEIYQQSGSRQPINIISAYRSPVTNEMLRSNSNGVAQNSQHIRGKAMDFQLPDVSLTKLRNIALRMQIGGVGFYPTSGAPFIHVDTGSVRHWPRLGRTELASVFPDGHTLHIPSDGNPLPGYQEAQLAYQERGDQVVALLGDPVIGETTRLAALFDRGTPEPTAVTQAVVAAATIAPTLITNAPVPRPELPGIIVAAPEPRAEVLAFAPETTADHDPLQILEQTPIVTAALLAPVPQGFAAPTIQRRWYDPFANGIIPPSLVGSNLPFLSQTVTTRQADFAQLTLPYVEASPEFLAKPDRIIEGGFLQDGETVSSARFVIAAETQPQLIDLTRLSAVAQR